ncbi:hypothetical protein cyc_06703 [Cyclospora cayetanensis]|uniref:Uncharacterized protein n=1 Tax=Cyclospora cayetanensis TaxID=88456 RepID=A0A1D3CW40_9EIME|nr:hypothetical protein cyc_06703 [Cyclospora cayetanensis]
MEVTAAPDITQSKRESTRKADDEETSRSWRRDSSSPRQRVEGHSRGYSDEYASPRRHRGRRNEYESPDGRYEGTFTIKGLPRPEKREPRRRPEPTNNGDRDCMLKGTLTFKTE